MRFVAFVFVCPLLVAGCGKSEDAVSGTRGRVATTRGSAVAVTYDERIAVVTNRTDGIVSVHPLTSGGEPGTPVEIPVRPLNRSMPWAAVIGADDDTAYVLLRGLGQVMRVSRLHGGAPVETGRVDVGASPTAIAISPSGKRLYVANWGDGTISVILTSIFEQGASAHAKWDLNLRLATAGGLGQLLSSGTPSDPDDGIWSDSQLLRARPALAHPRALAMTDDMDEDDDDEVLYASEFFSQPILDPTVSDPDRNRRGLVYPIVLGIGAGHAPLDPESGEPVNAIELPPLDTEIVDARGESTACVPNQLYAMVADAERDRLLVTSMCASPGGPVEAGQGALASNNFKTLMHSAVLAISTRENQALPRQHLVFTRALERRYESSTLPPEQHRLPLIPADLVVSDGSNGREAYVVAFGAGGLFPIGYDAEGRPTELGMPGAAAPYIDVGESSLPVGVALLRSSRRALVVDDQTSNIAVVDLQESRNLRREHSVRKDWANDPETQAGELISASVREGRRLFVTGLTAWSLRGQGWSSCEGCHPDGFSDGLVWRFARGPRRTISAAGTYHGVDDRRRVMLWTANIDEIHDLEGVARATSGGVGGVIWSPYGSVPEVNCRLMFDGKEPDATPGASCKVGQKSTEYRHNGLNGGLSTITAKVRGERCDDAATSCSINASTDWDKIDAFIRTVRAPAAPVLCVSRDIGCLDAESVARGRQLFIEARCAACHGGPAWTIARLFYEPGEAANGALPYDREGAVLAFVQAPTPGAARSKILGTLRSSRYEAPNALFRSLNMPLAASSDGRATLRPAPAPETTDTEFLDYFYPPSGSAPLDQLNCVLRDVGTFPRQTPGEPPDMRGVVPDGAPGVLEERLVLSSETATEGEPSRYDQKLAVGETGFNIPTLVGLSGGGPYFHAGNARTLEEVFHPRFRAHHAAIVPDFQPTPSDVRNLVSFLLSLDEEGRVEPIEPGTGLDVDPDLCR